MARTADELKALLNSGDIDGFERRLSESDRALFSRAEFVDLIPHVSPIEDRVRREALIERIVDLASTAYEAPYPEGRDIRRSFLARAVASGSVTDAVMKFFERQPGDTDEALKILDLTLAADAVRSLGPGQVQSAQSLLHDRDKAYVARFADAVGNSALAESVRASQELQPAPAADRPRVIFSGA